MLIEHNTTNLKAAFIDKLTREVVSFLNYRGGGEISIEFDAAAQAVGVADFDALQDLITRELEKRILPPIQGLILFSCGQQTPSDGGATHLVVASGPDKPYYIKKSAAPVPARAPVSTPTPAPTPVRASGQMPVSTPSPAAVSESIPAPTPSPVPEIPGDAAIRNANSPVEAAVGESGAVPGPVRPSRLSSESGTQSALPDLQDLPALPDQSLNRSADRSLDRVASPRKALTFSQLEAFYLEQNQNTDRDLAEQLEFFTPEGAYNYTAYLLADENGVSIQTARYAGMDKTSLIHCEEHGYRCLARVAESVLRWIDTENVKINAAVLREAVINAILHNDYSLGAAPLFEIFSDRVEITSHGGLPEGLSEEDFFRCRPMARNRGLTRVFRDLGLARQLGSGVSLILRFHRREVFDISAEFLSVSLAFGEKDVLVNELLLSPAVVSMSERDRRILEIICGDTKLSKSRISQISGVSLATIKRTIARFIDMGILEHQGPKRAGCWVVKPEKTES